MIGVLYLGIHWFNDIEGLRIAAEMERRGQLFYQRSARISRSPEALELLNSLAADEREHYEIFLGLYEAVSAENPAVTNYNRESSAFLSAIAADIVFAGGLTQLGVEAGFDDPKAILRYGIQSEKDSILFYSELVKQTENAVVERTFREIIEQEMEHLYELTEMLKTHLQGE